MYCEHCGATVGDDERFCGACGQPVDGATDEEIPAGQDAGSPEEAVAGEAILEGEADPEPEEHDTSSERDAARPQTNVPTAFDLAPIVSREWRTGTSVRGYPVALWVVIALYALSGSIVLIQALRALPGALDLLSTEFFLARLALILIVLILLIALTGAGLIAIAVLLHRASRVGRGLAYVVASMLVTLVIFGENPSNADIVAMIVAAAAAAVLALSPAVAAVFTGADARDADQPSSIVVARVCVTLLLALSLVLAAIYFILGTLEGKYYLYGLIALAVAYGAYSVSARLTRPDRQARVVATIGAGLFVVVELIAADGASAPLTIGLAAAIPIFLWLPRDARAFYGDPPIRLGAGS